MIELAYILAASHSGSTLLAMLLGAHPEICTIGELGLSSRALKETDQYRCSCQALIKACPFWEQVRDCMARRGYAFDIADAGTHFRAVQSLYARRLLQPLHRGPLLEAMRDAALGLSRTWRRGLPEIQRKNIAVMESISEITGGRVVVDSSKMALRLKYLLQSPELDVKVIHLVRDGRGVALSHMEPALFADAKESSLRGGGLGRDRADERLSISEAAREWRRSNEEMEHVLDRLDRSQWIQIRYEDICANPDATLRSAFEFLDLEPDSAPRDFRSAEHHVTGNGMRLDSTSEIVLDDRWKSVLIEEDLKAFDSVAGEISRRYGYT